ncbi:MAG TPA: GNAT family N-acetyltransferase [Rhizomicrobium sp.]|jgi:phosphinothricin acetyltransferase|nr:GNAT family N-acetyltransferase [Rhizomicrobium sp.]
MTNITYRVAEDGDLPALLDIYNHYVVNTPVNFDVTPRTLAQRRVWFAQFAATGRYRCFVAARDGGAIGYACSAPFKEKEAYATTIETSIYLAPGEGGQGLGRALYGTLFDALKGEDIHRAFGGITLPNDASVGVHRAQGFAHIGTYHQVGRKFGTFWDVGLYLKTMG